MTTRQVIATRVLPTTTTVRVALIVGFALLTAAAAQISIPLWFTPVPITGQTFAVLLTGAALGWRDGAAAQGLYVALGAVGLPFYAEQRGGWDVVTGATGGYLVGFIVAAALIGYLAERRHDRNVVSAAAAFIAGSAVIYLFGVTWLMASLDVDAVTAMSLGLTPFVIGDLVKIGLASLALPSAWRLAGRR